MKKHNIFILTLSGIILFGGLILNNTDEKVHSTYAASSKKYTTDIVNYYKNMSEQNGNSLLGSLHDLIVSTHETYTSYDDIGGNGLQKYIDQDPDNESNIIEFYSQVSWPSNWNPNAGSTNGGYNREHVWCQSLSSGLWGTRGGGSDMHHIRPDENRLNSKRGNNKYGEVSHSSNNEAYAILGDKNTPTIKALGGYCDGGLFEPIDASKGDVARILMYMYTHYNSASNVYGTTSSPTSGNLPITNVVNASTTDKAWELLLKWNKLDPVSIYEINRNNRASEYQGNRNPFIDYPDLANCIWGDEKFDWTSRSTISSSTSGESISLSKTSVSMVVGGKESLTINVTGSGSLSISNSNENVVTYALDGNVLTLTAVKEGSANLSITYGNAKTSLNIVVKSQAVLPNSISLNKTSLTLDVSSNAKANLKANISPSNVDNKIINVSASKANIVSFPSSFSFENEIIISAINEGEVTLTFKCDGNQQIETSLDVKVIRSQVSTTASYKKITSLDELSDGKYLIVYDGGSVAFNGSLNTLDASSNNKKISIENSVVLSNSNTDSLAFNITKKSEGTYSISSVITGLYIGNTSNANSLKSSKDDTFSNKITFNNDGTINIISSESYLRFNATANQNRFRYYKSSTYTNQKAIYLYKYEAGSSSLTYTIENFAKDFNDLTGPICEYSKNNGWISIENKLSSVWERLNSEQYYLRLSENDKNAIKTLKNDEQKEVVKEFLSRYDHIISRYNLNNFLERNITNFNSKYNNNLLINNSFYFLIIVSSSILLCFSFYLTKFKHH